MIFPNEVYCSILIDPRDLGNVIDGKNSIDPRELTVLPDEFHPLSWGVVADVMMEFASARRAARDDGIDGPGWTEHLNDGLSGVVEVLRGHSGWSPEHPFDANAFLIGDGPRDDRARLPRPRRVRGRRRARRGERQALRRNVGSRLRRDRVGMHQSGAREGQALRRDRLPGARVLV